MARPSRIVVSNDYRIEEGRMPSGFPVFAMLNISYDSESTNPVNRHTIRLTVTFSTFDDDPIAENEADNASSQHVINLTRMGDYYTLSAACIIQVPKLDYLYALLVALADCQPYVFGRPIRATVRANIATGKVAIVASSDADHFLRVGTATLDEVERRALARWHREDDDEVDDDVTVTPAVAKWQCNVIDLDGGVNIAVFAASRLFDAEAECAVVVYEARHRLHRPITRSMDKHMLAALIATVVRDMFNAALTRTIGVSIGITLDPASDGFIVTFSHDRNCNYVHFTDAAIRLITKHLPGFNIVDKALLGLKTMFSLASGAGADMRNVFDSLNDISNRLQVDVIVDDRIDPSIKEAAIKAVKKFGDKIMSANSGSNTVLEPLHVDGFNAPIRYSVRHVFNRRMDLPGIVCTLTVYVDIDPIWFGQKPTIIRVGKRKLNLTPRKK